MPFVQTLRDVRNANLRRLRIRPEDYTFVDIGAGKGAALMMAHKFPFRRLLAIEFSTDLIGIARRNVVQYEKVVCRPVPVEWVCQDFMTSQLPDRISLLAAQHIEASLRQHPRRAVVVWRKVSATICQYLDRSTVLRPLEWSPYWRAYESIPA